MPSGKNVERSDDSNAVIKRILFLFLFIALGSTFSSCKSECKEVIKDTANDTVTVDTTPIKIEKEGGQDTLRIIVSKGDYTLTVLNQHDEVVACYPCAVAKNYGNKMAEGDNRTPEGTFHIKAIDDCSSWPHDFGDGKGYILNAYGPYFFRINSRFGHIGIHGTHQPESMGTRCTEGCIRLRNEDILELHKIIEVGMEVKIIPSKLDRKANGENL